MWAHKNGATPDCRNHVGENDIGERLYIRGQYCYHLRQRYRVGGRGIESEACFIYRGRMLAIGGRFMQSEGLLHDRKGIFRDRRVVSMP